MPLSLTERKLFLLDFCRLVSRACAKKPTAAEVNSETVLHSTHQESKTNTNLEFDKPICSTRSIPECSSAEDTHGVSNDSECRFEPVESTTTSSAGSRVIHQVPDTVPSIPSHGQRIFRYQSPIPAGDSSECRTARGAIVPSSEGRGIGPPQDRLRQGEEGTDLSEGRAGRPPLYGMVHIDLQELNKGTPPEVHPLCQPVHRSTRTTTGRREDSRD